MPTTSIVFLSYSRPIYDYQNSLLEMVIKHLQNRRDTSVVTLGLQSESAHDPLGAIKDAIAGSHGLIALAFRRTLIGEGTQRVALPDGSFELRPLENKWLTSSYCHIEVAMAFQSDLPLLIFQEADVVGEGVLDRGSTGPSIHAFEQSEIPTTLPEMALSEIGLRIDHWVSQLCLSADVGPDA